MAEINCRAEADFHIKNVIERAKALPRNLCSLSHQAALASASSSSTAVVSSSSSVAAPPPQGDGTSDEPASSPTEMPVPSEVPSPTSSSELIGGGGISLTPGEVGAFGRGVLRADVDFAPLILNKGVNAPGLLPVGEVGVMHDAFLQLASSLCAFCNVQSKGTCSACCATICEQHGRRSTVGRRSHQVFCLNCSASESDEAVEGDVERHLTSAALSLGASSVFAVFKEDGNQSEWPLVCPDAVRDIRHHSPLPLVAWSTPEPLRKGGPVVPVAKKRARGSKDVALEIARNAPLSAAALTDFESLVYAAGVKEVKDSKYTLWCELCKARGFLPVPLIRESILQIAAILRAAGYSSALQYVSEAKQMHIKEKWQWTEDLQIAYKDAERAINRASGLASKAEEVRVLHMALVALRFDESEDHLAVADRHPGWPYIGARGWIGACLACLREVELGCLTFTSDVVKLNRVGKFVTLHLTVSKSDPAGRGVKRTFGCRCSRAGQTGQGVCCYCCFESMVDLQEARLGFGQDSDSARSAPLIGAISNPAKFVSKNCMVDALQHFAQFVKDHVLDARSLNVESVSGHSLRRAGIKYYARKGLKFPTIQWLARHSSDATKGYIEEAMEESPDADRKLDEADSFADQVVEMRSRVDSVDDLCKQIADRLAGVEKTARGIDEAHGVLKDNFCDVVSEVEAMAKPKAVLNLVTCKLHSTRPGSFVGPPSTWETKCGWHWILAGRMAQTVNSKAECTVKFSVCKTCSGYLEDLPGLSS